MLNNSLPKTLYPFIWHFLKPHKSVVIICVVLSIAAGFWGPFNSMLIKQLINLLPKVVDGEVSILIVPASLVVINFIIFDNFTWRGIGYIWAKFVPILQNRIIAQTLDYALSQSHGFYQNSLSGKISKQITNLVDGITRIITVTSANFLRGASLLLMAFIAAYFVNPIFSIILIAWFLFFAGFSIVMSKKLVSLSDMLAEEESSVVGELVDSLSNHNNVRIFSRKSYENLRMIPFFGQQQKAYTRTYLYSTLLACIQGGLIAIMMTFSTIFLVYLYGKGLITVGDFVLILGLSMETGHMMWSTMDQVDEYNKAVGRCKQSLTSLMVPIDIVDKPDAKILMCHSGQIIFNQVKFHYKGTEALFQNKG